MRLYLLRGCPMAHRATIVLREKHLPFEPVFFEMGKRPPELEAVGPHAKSPTLFDGDVRVWDSEIVISYLEDRTPEPALLPADAAGRAAVRMLQARVGSELGPAVHALVKEAVYTPEPHRDAGRIQAAKQGVLAAMAPWDAQLAGRTFLVGGALSLADVTLYTLFPSLGRLANLEVPHELANLRGWIDRMSARPSAPLVLSA